MANKQKLKTGDSVFCKQCDGFSHVAMSSGYQVCDTCGSGNIWSEASVDASVKKLYDLKAKSQIKAVLEMTKDGGLILILKPTVFQANKFFIRGMTELNDCPILVEVSQ